MNSSLAGFQYYLRPSEAGPVPPSYDEGSNILRSLSIGPVPVDEHHAELVAKWDAPGRAQEPYYKELATALDQRGLAWNLITLAQIRLPALAEAPVDRGHPSIVVGVAKTSSAELVAEVASEVQVLLHRHSITSTVGITVINFDPHPLAFPAWDVPSPDELKHCLSFSESYDDLVVGGMHYGRSISSLGGPTGSAGPLVRLQLPDGTTHIAMLTCHHTLTTSSRPIQASLGGSGTNRPVVTPSDGDHATWIECLRKRIWRHENKPDEPIKRIKLMIEAEETLDAYHQKVWDSYKRERRNLDSLLTHAESFDRCLGYTLCTSGLVTVKNIDDHVYAQDWGLVVVKPEWFGVPEDLDNSFPRDLVSCGDDFDGTPHWLVGRSSGRTVNGQIVGGLGTTAYQKTEYKCDGGEVLVVTGAARMLLTEANMDQPGCKKGDSGAVVFGPGPHHRVAGILLGGDPNPDWRAAGEIELRRQLESLPLNKLMGLRLVRRTDNIYFFTPIQAVLEHVRTRLEEDLGGKVLVDLVSQYCEEYQYVTNPNIR